MTPWNRCVNRPIAWYAAPWPWPVNSRRMSGRQPSSSPKTQSKHRGSWPESLRSTPSTSSRCFARPAPTTCSAHWSNSSTKLRSSTTPRGSTRARATENHARLRQPLRAPSVSLGARHEPLEGPVEEGDRGVQRKNPLLGEIAAIDGKHLPGDEAGVIGGQEHDRPGHLGGLAETFHRMLLPNEVDIATTFGRLHDATDGLGLDCSRRHCIHAYAMLSPLDGQMPGQTGRDELCRAVGRLAPLPSHPRDRRQADYRATSLPGHLGDRILAGQEHPASIDIHHGIPVVRTGFHDGAEGNDACVGDEDVDAAVAGYGGRDHGFRVGRIGDVADNLDNLRTC